MQITDKLRKQYELTKAEQLLTKHDLMDDKLKDKIKKEKDK